MCLSPSLGLYFALSAGPSDKDKYSAVGRAGVEGQVRSIIKVPTFLGGIMAIADLLPNEV